MFFIVFANCHQLLYIPQADVTVLYQHSFSDVLMNVANQFRTFKFLYNTLFYFLSFSAPYCIKGDLFNPLKYFSLKYLTYIMRLEAQFEQVISGLRRWTECLKGALPNEVASRLHQGALKLHGCPLEEAAAFREIIVAVVPNHLVPVRVMFSMLETRHWTKKKH